jgi:hypothetical protein
MKNRVRAVLEVLVGVTALAASAVGDAVSLTILLEVQKALASFAGLVVTIFGIWIAVIFPGMTASLSSGAPAGELPQVGRYRSLVHALYRSCFALCACFVVFLLLSFYGGQGEVLARSVVCFSWLTFCSIALALWTAVFGGEMAVVDGVNGAMRGGLVRRVRSLGRRKRTGDRKGGNGG